MQVSHAWQGKHLGKMLELYRHHSQPYRSPGFYSGYNELVYASNSWNPRLPHTVEAFFYVRGQDWDRNGPTAEKHRQFLRQYAQQTKPTRPKPNRTKPNQAPSTGTASPPTTCRSSPSTRPTSTRPSPRAAARGRLEGAPTRWSIRAHSTVRCGAPHGSATARPGAIEAIRLRRASRATELQF